MLAKQIKEEDHNYENSCIKESSFNKNPTPIKTSKCLDFEKAAAVRHREEHNLKHGIQSTQDLSREGDFGVKGTASGATEDDKRKLQSDEMELNLKYLLTDEADYLQPKSPRASNYLDVVEGWEQLLLIAIHPLIAPCRFGVRIALL